jgi:hypothetical protein
MGWRSILERFCVFVRQNDPGVRLNTNCSANGTHSLINGVTRWQQGNELHQLQHWKESVTYRKENMNWQRRGRLGRRSNEGR